MLDADEAELMIGHSHVHCDGRGAAAEMTKIRLSVNRGSSTCLPCGPREPASDRLALRLRWRARPTGKEGVLESGSARNLFLAAPDALCLLQVASDSILEYHAT